MKKSNDMMSENLLKGFEYFTIVPPIKSSLNAHQQMAATQRPPMHVKIDFTKSKFYMQADWKYIVESNVIEYENSLSLHSKRVEISMNMFPRGIINMEDSTNDGVILFLEGKVMDDQQSNVCTGMLVFSRNLISKTNSENSWYLNFYLYEYRNAYVELKFKLPIYLDSLVLPGNFRFPDPC